MSRSASTKPALWARLLRRTKSVTHGRSTGDPVAAGREPGYTSVQPPTPSSTCSSFSTYSGFSNVGSEGTSSLGTPGYKTPTGYHNLASSTPLDHYAGQCGRNNPMTPGIGLKLRRLSALGTGVDTVSSAATESQDATTGNLVLITGNPRFSTMMIRRAERKAQKIASRPRSCPAELGLESQATTANITQGASDAESGCCDRKEEIELGSIGSSKLFARRRAARLSRSLKEPKRSSEPVTEPDERLPAYLATPDRRAAYVEHAARDVTFGFEDEVELWPAALLRDLKRASSNEQ